MDMVMVVVVVVVVIIFITVVVVVVVMMATFMTMGALMEQEGEDAEKAKLGVCVNSHCLFTSRPLQTHKKKTDTRLKLFSCNMKNLSFIK